MEIIDHYFIKNIYDQLRETGENPGSLRRQAKLRIWQTRYAENTRKITYLYYWIK